MTRLARLHNARFPELELLDAYYEGRQPLPYMHPELLRRMDSRLRSVVINWPQLIVDSLDERLDVTGFRLGGKAAADRELWHIWQANRLDLHSEQAHVDALTLGRSSGHPHARGPAALKRQYEEDGDGYTEAYATLYLPNETV